jgi:hypothetical protein
VCVCVGECTLSAFMCLQCSGSVTMRMDEFHKLLFVGGGHGGEVQ